MMDLFTKQYDHVTIFAALVTDIFSPAIVTYGCTHSFFAWCGREGCERCIDGGGITPIGSGYPFAASLVRFAKAFSHSRKQGLFGNYTHTRNLIHFCKAGLLEILQIGLDTDLLKRVE